MTKPAAFQATYSDFRLVKGRKVAQFVFEVPLEMANVAYEVLGGLPNPASEVWCGVARIINPSEVEAKPASEPPSQSHPVRAISKKSWNEMDYAQQAGMLCNDPKFIRFLIEGFRLSYGQTLDSDGAAKRVREFCQVQSRSEIKPQTSAGTKWELLVSAFRAWDMAPSVGAA